MGNRPIKMRKYYAAEIALASPLCVSGGKSEATDADVLVNGSGEVFVPGTSLAGAMRDYLEQKKNRQGFFGYSDGEEGRMSSAFISDLYFEVPQTGDKPVENKKPVISVRDGVQLSEKKTVKNKFDMQIVETGARGVLYLNYIVRENDDADAFEQDVIDILCSIQSGAIRIGANKNRGFGRFSIERVFERGFEYGSDGFDIADWIAFKKNARDLRLYGDGKDFEAWSADKTLSRAERFVRIHVPLILTGGISIRKYSTRPKMADFEQITCNGNPVIPGSSWNGAIRADVRDILLSIGMPETQATQVIETWFGKIANIKDKDGSRQSRVVISESVITGATALPMTRNRINRFDSSTKDKALYSEISYFGGKTSLDIMVRKDRVKSGEDNAYHALLAVLDMVVKDVQKGYVAVGGQTAVGRGIFAADPAENVIYSETISEKEGQAELYSLIGKGGKD